MNPYPVLTKLNEAGIFATSGDAACWRGWIVAPDPANGIAATEVRLTPAEVLSLADELKAFVAAQTPPAADPYYAVIDEAAYDKGAAAFRKILDLPEPSTSIMAELPSGDPT